MARCFGSKHSTPNPYQQQFLIKCLVCDSDSQSLVQELSRDEHQRFTRLEKSGIVTEVDGYVRFTSPLAERYYNKWLFPDRAYANPESLYELIRKVIGSMSASLLKQSVSCKVDFANEAVFQHQFMTALARNTMHSCYICPESSRVFPAPGQPGGRIAGEIGFNMYLNGDLRWGLKLLVNDDRIGEHMSRFAPGGKYGALAANDWAVIDFRGTKNGKVTKFARDPERITVF